MKIINKTLAATGFYSTEKQITNGVAVIEGLLETIKNTKSDMLGLISGDIYNKTEKILELESEVKSLHGLKDAVNNLGN